MVSRNEGKNEYYGDVPPPGSSPLDQVIVDKDVDAPYAREVEMGESEPQDRKRKGCLHWLCCICCPCFPMWMRFICCFLLIVIIALAITAGVLAALFKTPQVVFNGPTDDPSGLPRFQRNDTSIAFSINLGLNFSVVNPNVEFVTFDPLKAVAYYPTAPSVPVGGGEIHDLHIRSYATTNFIFPFQIQYDPSKDPGYVMLIDILDKCGLRGGTTKQDLTVNYDLIPTVRILGYPFSITLHQSANFACPITDGQLSLPPNLG